MIRRNVKRILKRLLSLSNVSGKHVQQSQEEDFEKQQPPSSDTSDRIADDDPILDCEIDESGILDLQRSGKEIIFIEIREPYEYRQGYIENALMIPMNEIPNVFTEFSQDIHKIIYCAAGMRSFDVCVYLRQKGVENIYSLDGGVGTWAKHSYVFPPESTFHVGQMIELEDRYIVQHIFINEQKTTIKLINYSHHNKMILIFESELEEKMRQIKSKENV